MKKISILFLFLCVMQLAGAAVTKEEADHAYQNNDFKTAIAQYEEILATQGESAAIYFNLGNSYFKEKEIAKAVLNYERALLLNPGDADIRFNLEMAHSKTVDQITPARELFLVTWKNALMNTLSERAWGILGICSFMLLLAGLAFYIFGNRLWVRKVGFLAGIAFLMVTLVANLFASEQRSELENRNGAVVMTPSVTVKSTPNESGTDLFVLHEGTKVYIEDNSMKGWKEIRLEDGNKGWLPAETIELI